MPKYIAQIPMLPSGCIEKTQAFYEDVLGFTVIDTHLEEGSLEWIRLRADAAQVMFYNPEASGNAQVQFPSPESMVIYLQVDALDKLHARLKAQGLPVSEIRVTFYGMNEFDLADPNSYTLTFGHYAPEL